LNILLIEDDQETAENIVQALQDHGHCVDAVFDGANGLSRMRDGGYSAVIVDRMLPKMDGLSLVKQLRAEGSLTPVLFLTTMSGLDDRVQGLNGGGDDYLVKPFAMVELLARVNAITRHQSANKEARQLKAGDLEIDLIRRSARRGPRSIELTAQEFRLLEYLVRNAGRVVTRSMLLEDVWDLHFDPRTSIVGTHMSHLRSKIDGKDEPALIHNIRGVGYILRVE
jgi:two-component system OmpR family response regulator